MNGEMKGFESVGTAGHVDHGKSSRNCNCANCGKTIQLHEALICMHLQMHRYVCNMKCMIEFYK